MKAKDASPEKQSRLACPRCDKRMHTTGAPWNIEVCRCGLVAQYNDDGMQVTPNVAGVLCDLLELLHAAGIVPCTKCGQCDTHDGGTICRECLKDIRKNAT